MVLLNDFCDGAPSCSRPSIAHVSRRSRRTRHCQIVAAQRPRLSRSRGLFLASAPIDHVVAQTSRGVFRACCVSNPKRCVSSVASPERASHVRPSHRRPRRPDLGRARRVSAERRRVCGAARPGSRARALSGHRGSAEALWSAILASTRTWCVMRGQASTCSPWPRSAPSRSASTKLIPPRRDRSPSPSRAPP